MDGKERAGKRKGGGIMEKKDGRVRKIPGNKFVLLIVGLAAAGLALVAVATGSVRRLYWYLDLRLICWLTAVMLFMMWVTGIWKDFLNGFRLVFFRRKNVSRMEMQRAAKALEAAGRLAVLESVLTAAVYMVDFLYRMEDPMFFIGPFLSMVLLSILYTSVFSLVVVPIRVRLENMAVSFMEETGEEEENAEDGQKVYFRLRSMGLTDREAEVARLASLGLSNKEIGQTLYISDTTVKKHMTHILEKTGCGSREELTEAVKV